MMMRMATTRDGTGGHRRVAIVGTGFAGLGMAIRLKQQGIDDFVIFEAADGIGGTWRDNHYPGCACDVPSHVYSFSFERNPDWSRHFSPQAEILEYLEDCADKYDLRRHIRFGTPIDEARWDADRARWVVTTRAGERSSADVLVLGTGPLRVPSTPKIPGLDGFSGPVFHSARWDHAVDFAGKRVAAVGTGASAIQFVPALAPIVERMHVYQRTAPWVMPKMDGPIPEAWKETFRRHPAASRAWRSAVYLAMEALGTGFFVEPRINEWREKMALEHLAKHIPDPSLRAKLTPDYRMGCKRVLLSNDWYATLARPNVEVIAGGVAEVRGDTVVGSDGSERAVDAIVLGTGFRVTDFLAPMKVYGEGGRELTEAWRGGAEAYYGFAVAGYPNLYLLLGPNSGLGHNSMVFMIEAQVHMVLECLRRMEREQLAALEVLPEAQRRFNEDVQSRLAGAVWAKGGCSSWYLDEHGKNVTLWPGYTIEYWLRTRRLEPAHFRATRRAAARRVVPAPREALSPR